jgi:hypothetical protein
LSTKRVQSERHRAASRLAINSSKGASSESFSAVNTSILDSALSKACCAVFGKVYGGINLIVKIKPTPRNGSGKGSIPICNISYTTSAQIIYEFFVKDAGTPRPRDTDRITLIAAYAKLFGLMRTAKLFSVSTRTVNRYLKRCSEDASLAHKVVIKKLKLMDQWKITLAASLEKTIAFSDELIETLRGQELSVEQVLTLAHALTGKTKIQGELAIALQALGQTQTNTEPSGDEFSPNIESE